SVDPADPHLHAHINDLALRGDQSIHAWVEAAAVDLRWSIHLIETLFDPQTVILCGSAPEALVNRLIAAIGPLLPSIAERRGRTLPRLQPGMADPWSVALGAAAGPISRAFDPRFAAILKDSLQS
ncbi:ROK family transcriptional regulator, partial [Rhizobium ruizarguesonis]